MGGHRRWSEEMAAYNAACDQSFEREKNYLKRLDGYHNRLKNYHDSIGKYVEAETEYKRAQMRMLDNKIRRDSKRAALMKLRSVSQGAIDYIAGRE